MIRENGWENESWNNLPKSTVWTKHFFHHQNTFWDFKSTHFDWYCYTTLWYN
jgi:hypothetical protein